MRVLFMLALVLPGALAAQATKAAPKAAGPITAGGSSSAKTAAPPTAPVAGTPKGAPSTSSAASRPGAMTPPAPVVATKPGAAIAPAVKGAAVAAAPAAVAATVAAAKPGAAGKAAAAPAVSPAAAATTSAPASAQAVAGAMITIDREVYGYERGGRRDPYASLLQSDELRPSVSDLKLIGVVLDPKGRNSIAVMRDLSTKELYRVRPGQSVGRLRVTQISQRSVTFLIEEFGATRQETFSLRDSTTSRIP